MRWLASALLVLMLVSSGCTQGSSTASVEGIVVGVSATGLDDVQGFRIRTTAGETIDFRLGRLENATEFPPAHLAEHQATSQPVRVFFRVEGSDRVAYRIVDAG